MIATLEEDGDVEKVAEEDVVAEEDAEKVEEDAEKVEEDVETGEMAVAEGVEEEGRPVEEDAVVASRNRRASMSRTRVRFLHYRRTIAFQKNYNIRFSRKDHATGTYLRCLLCRMLIWKTKTVLSRDDFYSSLIICR